MSTVKIRILDRSDVAGYHHGNLRAALLDAATAEVAAHGADKVSLRALAGSLGVSPSAPYQHFGDKEALLAAVAEQGFAELGRRMSSAQVEVQGDDDQAAIGRFAAIGATYISFAVEQPHVFRLMFGPPLLRPSPGDDGAQRPLKSGKGEEGEHDPGSAYGVLTRTLAELDDRGLLRAPDDDGLRLMIWSLVHGFAHLAIEGQVDVASRPELFRVLRGLVLVDRSAREP